MKATEKDNNFFYHKKIMVLAQRLIWKYCHCYDHDCWEFSLLFYKVQYCARYSTETQMQTQIYSIYNLNIGHGKTIVGDK